jgi:hypothetical protein
MDNKDGAHDLPAQFQSRHAFVSTRRGRNSQAGSRPESGPVCWPLAGRRGGIRHPCSCSRSSLVVGTRT